MAAKAHDVDISHSGRKIAGKTRERGRVVEQISTVQERISDMIAVLVGTQEELIKLLNRKPRTS
jgi:hypothetical protein